MTLRSRIASVGRSRVARSVSRRLPCRCARCTSACRRSGSGGAARFDLSVISLESSFELVAGRVGRLRVYPERWLPANIADGASARGFDVKPMIRLAQRLAPLRPAPGCATPRICPFVGRIRRKGMRSAPIQAGENIRRYRIASAICPALGASSPARSAIVRATFSTR